MERNAIQEELQHRIESDIAYFGGKLPQRNALAWHAYLAGLLEWAVIDRSMFDQLTAVLPDMKDSPVVALETQRHPTEPESIIQDLRARIESDISRSHGRLPEREVIFWRAYLSALLEWSVIYTGFRQLIDLLPELDDDPVQAILLGRQPIDNGTR